MSLRSSLKRFAERATGTAHLHEQREALTERLAAAKSPAGAVDPLPAPTAPAPSPFDDPATVAWYANSGLVPYPAAAPQAFIRAETAIRLEAGLLLERARAEFARQHAAKTEASEHDEYRRALPGRLERELRIPELEAAAREPLSPLERSPAWSDASDNELIDMAARVCRLDVEIAATHAAPGTAGPVDELPTYQERAAERAALLRLIATTPAEALPGLRSKARAILSETVRCNYEEQCALAESLADDLLRLRPGAVEGRPDPIYAAIADSRRLLGAVEAAERLPFDEGSVEPPAEMLEARGALLTHRDDTLLGTVPQTAAGCLALARYAADFTRSQGVPLSRDDQAADLLELMAECPEGQNALLEGNTVTLPPSLNGSSFLAFLELASATVGELVAIQDMAHLVGSVADMAALRCRPDPQRASIGGHSAAARKMMVQLSDALNDVESEAERELERRTPTSEIERTLRLAVVAAPIIESDDAERITALGRDLTDHAAAQGR